MLDIEKVKRYGLLLVVALLDVFQPFFLYQGFERPHFYLWHHLNRHWLVILGGFRYLKLFNDSEIFGMLLVFASPKIFLRLVLFDKTPQNSYPLPHVCPKIKLIELSEPQLAIVVI